MGRRKPGAGSIQLRGGSYELRYIREDGKRTRKVLGRAGEIDEAEAARRADALLYAIRGAPAAGTDLTVARLLDSLEPVLASFLAAVTLRNLRCTCGRAAAFYGLRPARTVDVPAAQDFMATLGGRKGTTQRKYKADLALLWKVGHERGLVGPLNPWRHVRCRRAEEPEVRPTNRGHVERIAAAVGDDIADFLRFMCETGLRCGEANRLRWVDVRGGRVHVMRSKGGRKRAVKLTCAAVAILAAVRLRGREDRVFRGIIDGGGYDSARSRIVRACERLDLPRVTFHGCRHRFAGDLAETGCSEGDIAAVLGHADHELVRIYTRDLHPDAAGDRAVDRLERHRASSARKAE